MAVSGLGDEDERKALDYISTRLAMMVKELDFALILVSHVNDEGKTRGSRNISKIADCWIHMDRDQQAPSEEQRNTTYLTFKRTASGHVLDQEENSISIFQPSSLPNMTLGVLLYHQLRSLNNDSDS